MLQKTLHSELLKLKRSPIWLAFFIVPILPAAMGTFNYLQNTAVLQNEWYSLWTQHTLFLCFFFFPALMGVFVAYLYRLEHINHNWNAMLSVPIKTSTLVLSKLIIASVMVVLTQLWIGLLFILSGMLCGLTGMIEVFGIHKRFITNLSAGYYFDGMLVAMIMRYNPFGVILMSFFFAILTIGGSAMELSAGISSEVILIVQAVIIFFMAAEGGIRQQLRVWTAKRKMKRGQTGEASAA